MLCLWQIFNVYVMAQGYDLSLLKVFQLRNLQMDSIQAKNKILWNGLLIFFSALSLSVYLVMTYCPWLGESPLAYTLAQTIRTHANMGSGTCSGWVLGVASECSVLWGWVMEDSVCPGIMADGSSIARVMRPEGRQGDGGIEGGSSRSPMLC